MRNLSKNFKPVSKDTPAPCSFLSISKAFRAAHHRIEAEIEHSADIINYKISLGSISIEIGIELKIDFE